MPKRATSTSFGGKAGNKGNTTIPGTGKPPEMFKRRMQYLADLAAECNRFERILKSDETPDDTWMKAFDRVADRGYGSPAKSVDLTTNGESVNKLLIMPPEEPV